MSVKLKSISPIQIHLLGAALFILTASGSAYSVYASWKSHKSGIESSQHKLTQVTSELSIAQRNRARLVNRITDLHSIVKDYKSIIQPASINELAVQVVALAERHDLEIEQFEPSPPTILNQDDIQPVTIRFTAPYQSVTNWLNELHSTMPDIHVVGITIASQSTAEATVISDIRLNWFIPTSDDPAQ